MQPLLALLLATVPLLEPAAGGADVLGVLGTRIVKQGDSLIELARAHDVGFNAIEAANPGLDAYVPTPGAPLVVPAAWILPPSAAPGSIVVNLSEMRLYLLPGGGAAPVTYPVGIGKDRAKTPLGSFTVIGKTVAPTWYPPASMRRDDPTLPDRVPPGPDNPLGTHALRLSAGSILIHGTDEPFGIGRKFSHGCVRLYPEDIPRLFEVVPLKTPVRMVREPVKIGVRGSRVVVEAHDDPDARVDLRAEAQRQLERRGLAARVDAGKLAAALEARRGIPVDVSIDVF